MWTLDDIRTFVCGYDTEIGCPYCGKGRVAFEPALLIQPSWDDSGGKKATVSVSAVAASQSCLCEHSLKDKHRMATLASNNLQVAFSNFLNERSAPPAEDAAHREEVLAGKAY